MIREDPAEHTTTIAERRPLGHDGGGHGVVSTNPDTHEHSHAKEVPEFIPCGARHVVGQADDEYDTDHHDDHLFPIDKFPSKGIAEESKRQLTDDVADVGSRVDGAAQEEWIGGSLDGRLGEAAPILVCPYWGDQVDDEEIVGVEEETDTMRDLLADWMGDQQGAYASHPQMAYSLRSPLVMIRLAPETF